MKEGDSRPDEDQTLPLSAVQHMTYCPRRAALVTVEREWSENRWTAEGRLFHEAVHAGGAENRPGVHIARGVPLRSEKLGLYGVADRVEFFPTPMDGVPIAGLDGRWRPVPVEYKHGRHRNETAYRVQLCAQTLCLEEMLGVSIPLGDVYFGKSRRRDEVVMDEELRRSVVDAARELHELVREERTPPPRFGPHCRNCSMQDLCLPAMPRQATGDYVNEMLRSHLCEEEDRP